MLQQSWLIIASFEVSIIEKAFSPATILLKGSTPNFQSRKNDLYLDLDEYVLKGFSNFSKYVIKRVE